ncbi:MAG: glycosyltransferase [Bacteroidota bacterium]
MQTPFVSVMMPAYNAAPYIGEAIESILSQTYANFELIILDDGSTDDTLEIAKKYATKDSRIRLLENEGNQGLAFTRNRLLQEVKGAYLAILDSDDVSLPTRLEKQVAFLNAHPQVGLLGTAVTTISEKGEPLGQMRFETAPNQIKSLLLFQNCFAQSAVMLRREFASLGYRSAYPPSEDYDLWVRISRRAKVANLPEPLVKYRVHAGGISKRKEEVLQRASLAIRQWQLEELGLSVSEKEMALHHKIAYAEFEISLDFLKDGLHWLEKLKAANREKGIFDIEVFDTLLREYAQKVIAANLKLKARALNVAKETSFWSEFPRGLRLRWEVKRVF